MLEHVCCEEDINFFVPQQNMEQLSKCIVSLQEFYDDLANGADDAEPIFCPNEAEFRCYAILIRLSDPAARNEALTLRPEIFHSPDVQFAMSVAEAYHTGHYARFFKLVSKTHFLNAALLHKYFPDVRLRAFRAMNRAYKAGTFALRLVALIFFCVLYCS